MPLPFTIYALGAAGNTAVGSLISMDTDGRAANLNLVAGEVGTVEMDWAHEVDNSSEDYVFAVYNDGEPFGLSPAGYGYTAGPFAGSSIDLTVLPLRPGEAPPDLFGYSVDDKVYLTWTRGSEADLVSHAVYWDNAVGGSFSTLLATVSDVAADAVVSALPTTGTGTGTITLEGNYLGDAINTTWKVKVTGTGTWDYDSGSGYTGTDRIFYAGADVVLPNNLRVIFNSAVSAYDTNDEWEFRIGPVERYVTDSLAAGTYQFKVVALDAAGNASASAPFLSADVSVAVDPPPAPVTSPAAVWDSGTGQITLTWTDGADTANVNVYSNYSPLWESLDSYVWEATPIATVAASTETYTLTLSSGVRGTVYFYLRAEDSGGVEEENASLIEVAAINTTYNSLSAPYDLTGVQAAGGKATLSWYHNEGAGAPASFNLYEFTSEPGAQADFDLVTPTSVPYTDNGNPVSFTTATTAALGGQRWFAVRAVDGSGDETDNVDSVSVTPDSSAPAAPTSISGIVN